jgi:hypothetical protein
LNEVVVAYSRYYPGIFSGKIEKDYKKISVGERERVDVPAEILIEDLPNTYGADKSLAFERNRVSSRQCCSSGNSHYATEFGRFSFSSCETPGIPT